MFDILYIFSKQPWKEHESIYQFIKRNFDEEGKINDPFLELPDEDKKKEGAIKWTVGAMDGVLSHHFVGKTENLKQIQNIVSLFTKQINRPNKRNRINLYNGLKDVDALSLIDDLMNEIQKAEIDPNQLYNEARWLAVNGVHRNIVKFAIAIIGRFNTDDDELLLVLGKHEEFTLYVAVALLNKNQNASVKLLDLAKSVKGWGKIHIVERMRPDNDEIKRWLICCGCENAIMDEYLAYTCAEKGELIKFLSASRIDYEILRGAGRIIKALIIGGPASNINDYDDGAEVIENYVNHAVQMELKLEDIIVLGVIEEYLNESDEEEHKRLLALGWSDIGIKESVNKIKIVLSENKWTQLILKKIETETGFSKYTAIRAAEIVNLDIWDNLFNSLKYEANDTTAYFEMMKTKDVKRIQRLCNFAEEHLKLNKIIGKPEDTINGYDKDNDCLDYILQSLDGFEGVGAKLISVGLQAKSVRNRNMAIKALEKWDTEYWPEDSIHLLKILEAIEPNKDTLQKINKLLGQVN